VPLPPVPTSAADYFTCRSFLPDWMSKARSAPLPCRLSAPLPSKLPLCDTLGLRPKYATSFFAVSEAMHVSHSRYHSVKSYQIDATEPAQAHQCVVGHNLLSHVPAQQSATGSRCHQTTVRLLQQHGARRRPLP